jgi:hypothetical protein
MHARVACLLRVGCLSAANKAMQIDPAARARLFESTAIMERLIRNTVIGAFEDQADERSLAPE